MLGLSARVAATLADNTGAFANPNQYIAQQHYEDRQEYKPPKSTINSLHSTRNVISEGRETYVGNFQSPYKQPARPQKRPQSAPLVGRGDNQIPNYTGPKGIVVRNAGSSKSPGASRRKTNDEQNFRVHHEKIHS